MEHIIRNIFKLIVYYEFMIYLFINNKRYYLIF